MTRMKFFSSSLKVKGRSLSVFLCFFFSSLVFSQTIFGEAQIHCGEGTTIYIQESTGYYINGKKVKGGEEIQRGCSEKAKVYVSTGTFISNLESENIEIIVIAAKVKQTSKSRKAVLSETTQKRGIKEKPTEKPVVYTLKQIPLRNSFYPSSIGYAGAVLLQNFQQKTFATMFTSGHWKSQQIISLSEIVSYVWSRISSFCHSSFSIRPPPFLYYI